MSGKNMAGMRRERGLGTCNLLAKQARSARIAGGSGGYKRYRKLKQIASAQLD